MKSQTLCLVALAIWACLYGCGKPIPQGTAPKTVTGSVQKAGWKEIKSSGFRISVPPDWQPLDMTSKELDSLIAAAAETNPGIKSSEAMIRAAAASGAIKVMAFGPTEGVFTPNVNVVVLDQLGTPSPEQLKTSYESEMKGMLVSGAKPESEPVKLPAGDGYKMHSRLAMGSQEISSLAYLLAKDTKTYTITFSADPGKRKESEALASEVMQTFLID